MHEKTKDCEVIPIHDNGFTLEGEYITIDEGSIWQVPEDKDYRFIAGDIRLENEDDTWLEIAKETLKEHFIKYDEIDKLIDKGISIYEIAEKYSGDRCVKDFEMNNELCHKDADCNDCWTKCLEKRLSE